MAVHVSVCAHAVDAEPAFALRGVRAHGALPPAGFLAAPRAHHPFVVGAGADLELAVQLVLLSLLALEGREPLVFFGKRVRWLFSAQLGHGRKPEFCRELGKSRHVACDADVVEKLENRLYRIAQLFWQHAYAEAVESSPQVAAAPTVLDIGCICDCSRFVIVCDYGCFTIVRVCGGEINGNGRVGIGGVFAFGERFLVRHGLVGGFVICIIGAV